MIRHLLLASCAVIIPVGSVHAQDKTFLGKNAGDWVTQLQNQGDAGSRRSAAFALGKLGYRGAPALPAMKIAYAREKDARVKEALVHAMGEICREYANAKKDGDLEPLFIGALADADTQVRRSAVFALGCLKKESPATLKALETALGDSEAVVRQNAAWAMGRHGLDALPLLKRALHDNDSFVKRDAASALLMMEDADRVRELLKDLLPLCRDNNSEARRAVLSVLVQIVDPSDKDAIPSLLTAMEDRDLENRRNAALALSNIGGEEASKALPVLLEAIKNGDEDVRWQSVVAIHSLGPNAAKAVPHLIAVLRDDPAAKMRESAALALGGMKGAAESAVPLLVKKLQDGSEAIPVRIVSATALAKIGDVPAATAAAPALVAVVGDPRQEVRVRERVMWALRVHGENLRKMKGPKETFTRILTEPLAKEEQMLRYDAAYMLGMVWQSQAPDATLDVLAAFLKDDSIKLFERTVSGVGGVGSEIKGGKTGVEDRGKGDGRMMAADALERIGPERYARRGDIMKSLRALAADKATYEPLRKKAAALLKAAM